MAEFKEVEGMVGTLKEYDEGLSHLDRKARDKALELLGRWGKDADENASKSNYDIRINNAAVDGMEVGIRGGWGILDSDLFDGNKYLGYQRKYMDIYERYEKFFEENIYFVFFNYNCDRSMWIHANMIRRVADKTFNKNKELVFRVPRDCFKFMRV